MNIKKILSLPKKKSQPLKLTNKNILARMAYAETIVTSPTIRRTNVS